MAPANERFAGAIFMSLRDYAIFFRFVYYFFSTIHTFR
jgi:hypothetical protein